MSEYTRYENNWANGNALMLRPDYEELGVEFREMDIFPIGVRVKECVDLCRRPKRQIDARDQVVIGILSRLRRRLQKRQLAADLAVPSPMHREALYKSDPGMRRGAANFLEIDRPRLLINVNKEVIARIVQQPQRRLKQRKLVVCHDQIGMLTHRAPARSIRKASMLFITAASAAQSNLRAKQKSDARSSERFSLRQT